MASWQGEHRQRVQPSWGHQTTWAAMSLLALQARRVWPWCWDVVQLPSTCWAETMSVPKGTNRSFIKDSLVSLVLPGDRTALPSCYNTEINPEAKSSPDLKPRFPRAWPGIPAVPQGTGCMGSLVWQPHRGKDMTQDGYEVTCPLPDVCPHL